MSWFQIVNHIYIIVYHTLNSIPSWPTDPDYYWPVKREVTKEAFDLFYEYHGFQKLNLIDFSYDARYIKVALYTNNGIPNHASIQIDNSWWESKVGSLGIIKHDLFEMENKTYGQVTQIYKMNRNLNEILFFNEFILLD